MNEQLPPSRIMPHSVEAEKGVLGSMLNGGRQTIMECQAKLTCESFHSPAHQIIFDTIVRMNRAGDPTDFITVTQALRDVDEEKLNAVGGAAAITELFTFVPTAANVVYYYEIVREKFLLREIINAATEAVRRAFEEQDDVNGLVDQCQRKFTSLALSMGDREVAIRPIGATIPETLAEIEAIYHSRGGTRGLATGFNSFDRMTNGLKGGQLIIIAARPAMGKTAFALNMAEHITVDQGKPAMLFSLEMSRNELAQRLVLSRSRISLERLRDGFLKEADFPRLQVAAEKIKAAPLYIDDTPALRLFEFMARARHVAAVYGVSAIFVDYLQLMVSGSKRGSENRVLEITELTGGLKQIARELNVPVICLAQVNREAEKRPNAKPRTADLRESGSIEQDADIIGFLYRGEVYAHDEEAREELAGKAELIVAKHRNGPVGEVELTFIKEYTRFEDRAELYSNNPEHRQKVHPIADV